MACRSARSSSGAHWNRGRALSTEENTANATAFYDLMFNEYQPAEAIKRFVGDEYIQHKTELGDGK